MQGPSASTSPFFTFWPWRHDGLLVDAGVLVGALELGHRVDVRAHFAGELPFLGVALDAHDDAFAIDRIHHAGALADDDRAGVARGDALHAGADKRSFGAQQRNGLALHVRTHERAVGVVVFKERDQAGGNRDQLLGADVHVLDFADVLEHEVAGLAGVDQLRRDLAFFVQADVGLGDDVLVFFPSRKVIAMRFDFGRAFLPARGLVDFAAGDHLADLEFRVAGIEDLDFVDHDAVFDAAVGAFDKAVFVDARKAGQRADQADVGTFRRLNRADAAVVSGVHVADFESGAFTGKAAWSKGRETPLVRDLAQGVGLIHELRKLATIRRTRGSRP